VRVAAAVLLSVEAVRADDDAGAGLAVMELLAVLSASRVRKSIVHAPRRRAILP
jgi:hypothetical protein